MAEHWTKSVTDILRSKSGDLKVLAELGGGDWKTLYHGQPLSGCSLEGQDLRGMNLIAEDVKLAKFDHSTRFDPEIEAQLKLGARKRFLRISHSFRNLLDRICEHTPFESRGWLIKYLFPIAVKAIEKDFDRWREVIARSEYRGLYDQEHRGIRVELILNDLDYAKAREFSEERFGRGSTLTIVTMVGLLADSQYDFANDRSIVSKAYLEGYVRRFHAGESQVFRKRS